MTTDDPRLRDLLPDDPRVNPELYKLVYAAQKEVMQDEFKNLNPMQRPVSMLRQRLTAARAKVIADYQAAHPNEE